MNTRFSLHRALLSAFALLFLTASAVQANIWIWEDFEDGVAFDHAPGNATGGALDYQNWINDGADPGPTIDVLTTMTHTGVISSERSLSGSNSYAMTSGQGFAVMTSPVKNGNDPGDLVLFQMAVSIGGDLPADGQTVAELNMPVRMVASAQQLNMQVRFVADAGDVSVMAGQTNATTDTLAVAPVAEIDRIDPTEAGWKLITLAIAQKAGTDPVLGPFAKGIRVYSSNETPGVSLEPVHSGDMKVNLGSPVFTVSNGTVWVDDVYWEGAMTGSAAREAERQMLPSFAVPVALQHFAID